MTSLKTLSNMSIMFILSKKLRPQSYAVILFAFINFLGHTAKSELVDRIVHVVNNEITTESDIQALNGKVSKNGMLDETLLGKHSASEMKNNRQLLIDYLILEKILASEIKRLHLQVSTERVDQEVKEIAKRNGITKSELLDAIKSQGMNVDEYQEFLKNRIERQSLYEQEISSKIRISEDDLAAEYLKSNHSSNSTIEYNVAHIFLSLKKRTESEAVQVAESILLKLKKGESFESLAENYSEDPHFTSGGLLGSFKHGEAAKELEKGFEGLSPNSYSGPIRTKKGVHILKLLSKKIITDPRFEKEKEKIRGVLFERIFKEQIAIWLEQKRDEAFFRTNKL